jgi:ribonuclease HII
MTELKNYLDIDDIEVGIDEAGLGCVAGSFFVGGVILPKECPDDDYINLWNSIRDSKKVKKERRYQLADYIKEIALEWTIVEVDNNQVDSTNILKERLKAYHIVINQLMIEPDNILVDGDKFNPYPGIPHICIEKGDNKFKSIAAASILAKTFKDDHVLEMHKEYPVYSWDTNCCYLTKSHKDAILEYGITPYHRKTFGICKQWRELPQTYMK